VEEVVVQAPVPETAGEKPVAQLAHTAELVAPVTLENVVARQSVHAALPVVVLYFPAVQAVQEPPPFGPVNPALQMQFVTPSLAMGEVLLVGHAVHWLLPTTFFHVPAGHGVHELVPVYPAPHVTGHVTLQEAPIPEPRTE